MNEKFFNLPDEKQKAIINAGYVGFSRYGYKKSSMSEIAKDAGISKSLLFHYFRNKKEFYLYLYNYALELTVRIASIEINPAETDLFEIFMNAARVKTRLLKDYFYLSRFLMLAYYTDDEEIAEEIKTRTDALTSSNVNSIISRTNKDKLKEAIDINQLIKTLIWAGEGYMKEKYYDEKIDADTIEKGYRELLDFFKKICYKEEY